MYAQVGLAGSSAIVTAAFQCLMAFFGLGEREVGKEIQPDFVLSVEMEELFIQAGLQDRVIQTYGGCMYMDFSRELMEKQVKREGGGWGREREDFSTELMEKHVRRWKEGQA